MTQPSTQGASLAVIVTGVGAIIGQGIVKSLRRSKRAVRVVGMDRNPGSLGAHFCDVFYAKPACDESSPDYLAFWKHVIQKEAAALVLPGLEVDLHYLNKHRVPLGSAGAKLGLNTPALIRLSQDKWLLGQELPKAGLAPIPSLLGPDWKACREAFGPPPFLLKPRSGTGGQGIARLDDEHDLLYWGRKSKKGFMIQKIVGNDDEEYTVGAFGLGSGDAIPPIIFRRRLQSSGSTQYAEIAEDAAVAAATQKLNAYFKPVGPTNYQFRKSGEGAPYLLEINPRISSSTSLRTGFGYNEADMAIDFYVDGAAPPPPKVGRGRAWRYCEDYFQR